MSYAIRTSYLSDLSLSYSAFTRTRAGPALALQRPACSRQLPRSGAKVAARQGNAVAVAMLTLEWEGAAGDAAGNGGMRGGAGVAGASAGAGEPVGDASEGAPSCGACGAVRGWAAAAGGGFCADAIAVWGGSEAAAGMVYTGGSCIDGATGGQVAAAPGTEDCELPERGVEWSSMMMRRPAKRLATKSRTCGWRALRRAARESAGGAGVATAPVPQRPWLGAR
ncbi:hypothetical protein Efla_006852 [Eimeria flavescens]